MPVNNHWSCRAFSPKSRRFPASHERVQRSLLHAEKRTAESPRHLGLSHVFDINWSRLGAAFKYFARYQTYHKQQAQILELVQCSSRHTSDHRMLLLKRLSGFVALCGTARNNPSTSGFLNHAGCLIIL